MLWGARLHTCLSSHCLPVCCGTRLPLVSHFASYSVAALGRKKCLFPLSYCFSPTSVPVLWFWDWNKILVPVVFFLPSSCVCVLSVKQKNFTCLPLVVHLSFLFPTSCCCLGPLFVFLLPSLFLSWWVTARRSIFPPSVWGQRWYNLIFFLCFPADIDDKDRQDRQQTN